MSAKTTVKKTTRKEKKSSATTRVATPSVRTKSKKPAKSVVKARKPAPDKRAPASARKKDKAANGMFTLITSGPTQGVYVNTHGAAILVCPPLKPLGYVVDVDGGNPAMRMKMRVRLDTIKTIDVACDQFKTPKELLRTLINNGLDVQHELTTTRSSAISAYLRETVPEKTWLRVKQDGWLRLPDGSYGYALGEKLYCASTHYQIAAQPSLFSGMRSKGSLPSWRKLTERIAEDRVAVLLLCAGFASVLLQPMERESTCVIITAGSGKGKSTVLKLVSALFGPPTGMVTWEATENGLEAATRRCQHKPLVIDEIGQGSGALFAKASYRLTNLSGKLRAGPDGEMLPAPRNFSVVISAGEQSPLVMMRASGIAIKEGQRARLLCISVKERHGVWSTINGFQSGADKSKKIVAALNDCYGVAGSTFCAHVASQLNSLGPRYAAAAPEWRMKIAKGCKLKSSDGVVDRALESFVLFAYAGMLAIESKAVQWTSKEVLQAVRYGFQAWYDEHRRSTPMSDTDAMRQVQLFFQSKRGAKFKPFSTFHEQHAGELAGYEHFLRRGAKREPLFLVYPAYFEKEVCKGLDRDLVLKLLQQQGLLIPGARNVPTKQFHVPNSDNLNISFYAVKQSILLE